MNDSKNIGAILPPAPESHLEKVVNFKSHVYWGVKDPEEFKEIMDEACEQVAAGFYLGDNLFTWCRNNSIFDDRRFVESWRGSLFSGSDEAIVWRRYILATMAYNAIHLTGDFVECGTYSGTGIKVIVDYLGGTSFPKVFWGYDTFDSNPVEGHEFPGQQEGFFEIVKSRFKGYEQVKLIKGFIPDAFSQGLPDKIAFLHIDLNNAEAELASLEVLFERVVSGGVIILDDYEWSGIYRPQKIQEDGWFESRQQKIVPLPTGQGLLIKR